MKRHLFLLGLAGLLASAPAFAETKEPAKSEAQPSATPPASTTAAAPAAAAATEATPAAEHRAYAAGDLKWVDAPPGMPKGVKMALLSGDPAAPGMFTIRVQVPTGFRVPPHWHPADENLTVLSGELRMGLGDKWDETKGHALGVGAFAVMPKGMKHFAWTTTETTFQVHGMGPWGITYVNPQDDPRNQKQSAK